MVNPVAHSPHSSTSSFQRVARDVMDLFDLQMQLIAVDSQVARQKLVQAIACGVAAAGLGGSALTVLMLSCGFLLAESTDLSTGGGMLVASLVFFLLVAALAWIALTAVRSAAAAMSEAKSEFAENLRWLKATLISPDSSPRNQIRRETFPEREYPHHRDASHRYSFEDFSKQNPLSSR